MHLQTRAVHNLDVNNKLLAGIVEDENTNAATALVESLGQAGVETRLVEDGQGSLDITRLGHGGDGAVLDVEHTVLLEDRPKHGLDDDARSRVGDEGRLFMQLLAEQINTQVAVLAGGSRGRDADDLAGAALEHQDVTHADVVARDGDGVGNGSGRTRRTGSWGGGVSLANNLNALTLRMEDAVSHLVNTVAEGVVVS